MVAQINGLRYLVFRLCRAVAQSGARGTKSLATLFLWGGGGGEAPPPPPPTREYSRGPTAPEPPLKVIATALFAYALLLCLTHRHELLLLGIR
jgi:hypothetical protein